MILQVSFFGVTSFQHYFESSIDKNIFRMFYKQKIKNAF